MADLPANWNQMTDEQKRKWGDDQTNPSVASNKLKTIKLPADTKTVDEQIEELRHRSGGYLRAQGTDHAQ